LQREYEDALTLLRLAYGGGIFSRRTVDMPERRWRAAYRLLRNARVVVNGEVADLTYLEAVDQLQGYCLMARNPRFVRPG
jgi:hypothetical protein